MDEIIPGLYVGDREDAGDANLLDAEGIDEVISLDTRPPEVEGRGHTHTPLSNDGGDGEAFAETVERTISLLQDEQRVLVHCQLGVSRSVTVAATVMAEMNGTGLREALATVERARPEANPSPGMVETARSYLGDRDGLGSGR